MGAYYNENEPFAAQWLRELIAAGQIAPGDVDERDIRDVVPTEISGYTQCHFFAGIGVWSYALRRAGWPDDRPVWTGSCPCQPFSSAGKRGGASDERHLWPSFFHLIESCQPQVVFGEQVASKDGLAWLDLVQTDLEGTGYSVWPFDLCAAGLGAPHIRQRLYFVADAAGDGRSRRWQTPSFALQGELPERTGDHAETGHAGELPGRPEGLGDTCQLGNPDGSAGKWVGGGLSEPQAEGSSERQQDGSQCDRLANASTFGVAPGDANGSRLEGWRLSAECARELFVGQAGVAGFWCDADWIYCYDEKFRPVEPGTFPLADGAPARVGRLRGYGNSLVAPLAEEFVRAYVSMSQETFQ